MPLSSNSLDSLPSEHSQKRQMFMCAEVSSVCMLHYTLINECGASYNYLRTCTSQARYPDSSSLSLGRTHGGPTGHTKVTEIQWDLGQTLPLLTPNMDKTCKTPTTKLIHNVLSCVCVVYHVFLCVCCLCGRVRGQG